MATLGRYISYILLLAVVSCEVVPHGGRVRDGHSRQDKKAGPSPTPKQSSEPEQGFEERERDSAFWFEQAQETLVRKLKETRNNNHAKNVIFFIGDGLSSQTLAATRMYLGNEANTLSFEHFKDTGTVRTYCVDQQVADSACTATAFCSGVKTNYGMINVGPSVKRSSCEYDHEATEFLGLLQWAQKAGKDTGIVTNTRITHATPAGTYASVTERNWEDDSDVNGDCSSTPIERRPRDTGHQLVYGETASNLKVVLGCGRQNLLPKGTLDEDGVSGNREDGVNLIEEWKRLRNERGRAEYVYDKQGLLAAAQNKQSDYLLGLFDSSHCLYNLEIDEQQVGDRKPKLSEMVEAALAILEDSAQGYVLFVEGGKIDMAHHGNLPRLSLDETAEFHRTIGLARQRTNVNDTLIVVSSDHSHTLVYTGFPKRGNDILGIADVSELDGLPYTTLSYANGESFYETYEDGNPTKRINVSGYNLQNYYQRYPATVPLVDESHGGEDVTVYASGPSAHLFNGNMEQNVIPLLIAYVANIGQDFGWVPEDSSDPIDDRGSAVRTSLSLLLALVSSLPLAAVAILIQRL
ncbi:alkaline phosphatase-like [Anopheles bellator]|uniref:alkaline phosphatase-like n=1 Tax=Anopheles bellator TaxID=139047 RepID=UPI0026496367|nr:alkaline phosphatase-like [Anopheles bellator]